MRQRLSTGRHFGGIVASLPSEDRAYLAPQGILSILMLPVGVAGEWWGVVGFDDCLTAREWDDEDIRLLGTASEIIGAYLDRKRAEEALRGSEERFRALTESTSDCVWEVDAEGVYTYASPRVRDLLEYEPEEVLGKTPFDFMPAEEAERVAEEFGQIVEAQKQFAGLENTNRHKDGRLVVLETSGMPFFDDEGRLCGYRGIDRDITERKRAEQERATLVAELEAKNAELERFTYTVSHDLKSPLITINGFLGVMEHDIASGDAERVRSDVTRITGATQRMTRLLDELLELSRIGRVMNHPEEIPLGELARDAVDMVAGPATTRGVDVKVAGGLPVVYGDRVRLLEVLQNLVGNAVKFMDRQPSPQVEIGAKREGDETVCFVRDNGIGIDPRYHRKVFELFDKLDQKSEGTGVGLALVKRIVETHGGRIWVESEGLGHGCTFYFTLPSKDATED